ncbi:MAG: hypothetical protein Q7T48_10010 [Cellvibrio sp.]|uniref:hypothetical protein n=1 Tax=Cellvibrio sp. TaxID=1965322 RepID=UPI00271AC65D|nr:hypothetical protein [Cellvibrio sp.]
MSITINRLVINVLTADDQFGVDIEFSKGLFILRVENSYGKSTCINAIAYALGMEMALGQTSSKPPFPPSLLKSIQDENGVEKSVISSFVKLEISNSIGQTVTLKRNILGADADSIITSYQGTIDESPTEGRSLFLHKEGDTTRDPGFYFWLSKFTSWILPFVPNNTEGKSPLYPSLLFPLFFVEQKKGWSSIQASTPFHFQIPQAKKRAFEFIMSLDVNEIIMKKSVNKNLIAEVLEKWKILFVKLENMSIRLGGTVSGIKDSPDSKFDSFKIDILIHSDEHWHSLHSSLDKKRNNFKQLLSAQNESKDLSKNNDDILEKIRAINNKIREMEDKYDSIQDETYFLKNQIDSTELRIANLFDDQRKYEDLKKVKNFKTLQNLPILNNECPTCGQSYSDHSTQLECSDELMTLQESLDFIKSQISTFKSVLNSYKNQLNIKNIELHNLGKDISQKSQDISRLKESIYADAPVINEEILREKIKLEIEIGEYEKALVNIADFRVQFDSLYSKHKELLKIRKNLPEHGFSENDNSKLSALEKAVTKYLNEFGFSSFSPDLLKISKDTYLPTREGFDLGFDTSASDGIRVIWSYLLGIYKIREDFNTNHPGILIFDEPRQQEANKLSFTRLLKGASIAAGNGQIIFATSEEEEILVDALEGCDYKLLSFSPVEGKILRKIS